MTHSNIRILHSTFEHSNIRYRFSNIETFNLEPGTAFSILNRVIFVSIAGDYSRTRTQERIITGSTIEASHPEGVGNKVHFPRYEQFRSGNEVAFPNGKVTDNDPAANSIVNFPQRPETNNVAFFPQVISSNKQARWTASCQISCLSRVQITKGTFESGFREFSVHETISTEKRSPNVPN